VVPEKFSGQNSTKQSVQLTEVQSDWAEFGYGEVRLILCVALRPFAISAMKISLNAEGAEGR